MVMGRFGLVATGSDSWTLLRTPLGGRQVASQHIASSVGSAECAIANLRKTSAHPELWFFQSVGEPHMVPIFAEDYYIACKKYLLQIEEREIAREDLTLF
jgi:hypothetical protein